MNRKIILILIAVILLSIIVFAGYYIYTMYFVSPVVDLNNNNNINYNGGIIINDANVNGNQNTNTNPNQPQIDISKDDRADIQLLAIVFGQNFGSYSNQSDLSNFDEIYSFMGASMQNWVENTHKLEILTNHPGNIYHAIQTKVLNVQIAEINDDKNQSVAILNTQRQEFNETPDQFEVYNQDLLLNLIKVNDTWIVESAYWQ